MSRRDEKGVPTRDECLGLMGRYGMLQNIVDHSLTVTKVARFLSKELNKKGQRIDLGVVEAAALLHDLAKTECLKTKEDHAEQGFRLLKGLGYERVADVVAQHIEVSCGRDAAFVRAEEVVNYADKRVQHDRIVSLKQRFSDLKDRYGHVESAFEQMARMEKATYAIESKIFRILGSDPEDLQRLQNEKVEGID
jgi:putative nucleotidyltransferase with HDIG domain